jgi:hypothetical protein
MTPVVEAKCQLTGSIVILAPYTSALPSRDTMIRRNRHSASRVAFHGTRLSRFVTIQVSAS